MEKLAQGAEAVIYLDNDKIVKVRIPKKYRIKILDEKLRRYRTRREAKIISDMERIGVNAPKILDKSDYEIHMEFIKGKKVSKILDKENCKEICEAIGRNVAKMHDFGIVHGDLTTSNIILSNGKIYFIDFGLGQYSRKIEDKAVDLMVFRECLRSTHTEIFDLAWKSFLKGYEESKEFKVVLERMKKIEKRRRYT